MKRYKVTFLDGMVVWFNAGSYSEAVEQLEVAFPGKDWEILETA